MPTCALLLVAADANMCLAAAASSNESVCNQGNAPDVMQPDKFECLTAVHVQQHITHSSIKQCACFDIFANVSDHHACYRVSYCLTLSGKAVQGRKEESYLHKPCMALPRLLQVMGLQQHRHVQQKHRPHFRPHAQSMLTTVCKVRSTISHLQGGHRTAHCSGLCLKEPTMRIKLLFRQEKPFLVSNESGRVVIRALHDRQETYQVWSPTPRPD